MIFDDISFEVTDTVLYFDPNRLVWLIAIFCLSLSIPVFALTPLSEDELSKATAQDGTVEDDQLNELILNSLLLTIAGSVQQALPLEADISIEGVEYKEGSEHTEFGSKDSTYQIIELIHPNVVGIDRIEFTNIRLEGSPETFGNVHVQGVQVDQQINISLPR